MPSDSTHDTTTPAAVPAPPGKRPLKPKGWRRSVGEYGARVRVAEDWHSKVIGGRRVIYGELRDPATGKLVTRSLGRIAREEAIAWASEQAKALREHREGVVLLSTRPTVGRILGLYLQHHSARKSRNEQAADRTRAALFVATLGDSKDLTKLTPRQWQEVTDARLNGVVAADGTLVPLEKRKPVKASTVAADLAWLRGVCRWAKGWRDEHGRRLMTEDPTEGLELPSDPNVSRPVATTDRYRKLREVSDQITMEVSGTGKKLKVRTPLSEILDLAFHTGRRISAICQLQYADLHLDQKPYGAITWRADADKMGKAWTAPLNKGARAAIDRVLTERPGIGAAYLFPSPRIAGRPITKDLASSWLEHCERLAELPHLRQGLWHPFRRGWATARKGLPLQDVAAVGGWTDPSCLATIYMQPDPSTMVRVATEAAEVRDVGRG